MNKQELVSHANDCVDNILWFGIRTAEKTGDILHSFPALNEEKTRRELLRWGSRIAGGLALTGLSAGLLLEWKRRDPNIEIETNTQLPVETRGENKFYFINYSSKYKFTFYPARFEALSKKNNFFDLPFNINIAFLDTNYQQNIPENYIGFNLSYFLRNLERYPIGAAKDKYLHDMSATLSTQIAALIDFCFRYKEEISKNGFASLSKEREKELNIIIKQWVERYNTKRDVPNIIDINIK